jgi:hypothetical protein
MSASNSTLLASRRHRSFAKRNVAIHPVSGVDRFGSMAEMICAFVAYKESPPVVPIFDPIGVIVLVLAFVLQVFVNG